VDDWRLVATISGVLIVTGLSLIRAHLRTWDRQKNDSSLDHLDRTHYYSRYRRRMQTSAIIALLGLLIPLGVAVTPWLQQAAPRLFAVYWGTVLLMAGWVVVLGLGDMLATRVHSRIAMARVRQKQLELEKQISEIKQRRSNGHQSSK
jgi:hypothetical protein